jgi:hypothetical protein
MILYLSNSSVFWSVVILKLDVTFGAVGGLFVGLLCEVGVTSASFDRRLLRQLDLINWPCLERKALEVE